MHMHKNGKGKIRGREGKESERGRKEGCICIKREMGREGEGKGREGKMEEEGKLAESGMFRGIWRKLAITLSQTAHAQLGEFLYLYQRRLARTEGASGSVSCINNRISVKTDGMLVLWSSTVLNAWTKCGNWLSTETGADEETNLDIVSDIIVNFLPRTCFKIYSGVRVLDELKKRLHRHVLRFPTLMGRV